MKILLSGAMLASVLALSACSSFSKAENDEPTEKTDVTVVAVQEEKEVITPKLYTYNVSAQEDRLILQHPVSRELVICDSDTFTDDGNLSKDVEACAREMEKFGFIRVTNKPRFVNEDMDKGDSVYPYRLYHHNDTTPRW